MSCPPRSALRNEGTMKTVITIGRQYGSGGREVGQKLAAHYGINCYDSELLSKVAKESGFCQEIVKQQDERPTSSFLYNLVMDTYSFGISNTAFTDMPISQKVFLAQFDTIKKIAKEDGACVIIGRCADCALQDNPNLLSVFLHADESFRIARAANYPDVSDADKASQDRLREFILRKDKQRQSYYNYYSMKKWGRADTYHMSLDTGLLGIDGTVKLLTQVVEDFENRA